MLNDGVAGNRLPDLDPTAWALDKRFFDDSVFDVHPKQKSMNGRLRTMARYGAVLRRSVSPKAKKLGAKLLMCLINGGCLSGACTYCGTARGRGVALQAAKMFPLNNMALLTVIPSAPEFQHEDLAEFDVEHHRNAFASAFNSLLFFFTFLWPSRRP